MRSLRRLLAVIGSAVLLLVSVVLVEILVATRREFLPTEPAFEIRGSYGPEDGAPLSFMVLGDSTAAGLGAVSPDLAYAAVLGQRLAASGRRVEMTGVGVSGAKVGTVLTDQVPLAEQARPDLVFVGIGANDVTHLTGLPSVTRDMSEVVRRLRATGAAVVVAGAPDMRAAAFYEPLRSLAGWRGRQVAGTIEEAAVAEGATVVPLARLTAPFFAESESDHYSSDLFHPSETGYRRWADAIYPYLEQVLR